MALRTVRMHADKYIEDMELGMWFKLERVNYVSGNENDMNNQIDDANIKLAKMETEPKNQAYLACLSMMQDKFYNDLQPSWKNSFCAKTYLLIFNVTGKMPTEIAYSPWDSMFADGFVAYKQIQKTPYTIWEVATKFDSNNLAYRFQRANYKSEVKPYLDTFGTVTPPVTPPADDPVDPGTPGTVGGEIVFHVNCPHCGKKIF